MGGADIVPGVSGGTVALILGIYQRLVAAISHVDGTGKGTMTLNYKTLDQLDDICRRLSVTVGEGEV